MIIVMLLTCCADSLKNSIINNVVIKLNKRVSVNDGNITYV